MPTSEQVLAKALDAYQEAKTVMEAAHTAFLATLGVDGADVTAARATFDAAEHEMIRARRWWWICVATERTDPTALGGME